MATGNSVAFYRLDDGHLAGGIQPNASGGWDWYLRVAVREPATNRKSLLDAFAHTDDADSLIQVRDKHIAAVKAACLAADYAVTAVIFPGLTLLTGV